MAKTAVYLRVSTGKQSNGLEAQQRSLTTFLASRGVADFQIYSDVNQSGSKDSRPELDLLMSAVRAGRHSTVVVYSFSRFARSTTYLLESLELFREMDVQFISLTEQIDTATPMGRAMFTIISALGQLERELISERVKNGLMNARAKGKILGAPMRRNADLIQELNSRGISQRGIAKLVKCSKTTVQRELKVVRTPGPKKVTP